MIRNIKKIINLKNNLDLKFQFPNVLKKNLFEKLNYLKSSIKLKKQISLNKITNINIADNLAQKIAELFDGKVINQSTLNSKGERTQRIIIEYKEQ